MAKSSGRLPLQGRGVAARRSAATQGPSGRSWTRTRDLFLIRSGRFVAVCGSVRREGIRHLLTGRSGGRCRRLLPSVASMPLPPLRHGHELSEPRRAACHRPAARVVDTPCSRCVCLEQRVSCVPRVDPDWRCRLQRQPRATVPGVEIVVLSCGSVCLALGAACLDGLRGERDSARKTRAAHAPRDRRGKGLR
jgi:hypothetical protein